MGAARLIAVSRTLAERRGIGAGRWASVPAGVDDDEAGPGPA